MGDVYRARDTELKHEVAIKVLPEEFSRDASRVARFEREARMLAQMNHPNICVLYDLKREGDFAYLVLELVNGDTLATRLSGGPLEVPEALGIFGQIALALEAAHGKGVIHRDLKPQNVKITSDGVVKVLDFGLAKESFEASDGTRDKTVTGPNELSREGVIVGTVSYMSPEQARGQPVDKRTDIWAFGCCLFEALSGRRPFEGGTWGEIREAIRKKEPDFELLPSSVSPEVKRLLRRCLRKDPRDRLRDIADARFILEEAGEAPVSPRPLPQGAYPWATALWIFLAFGAGVLARSLVPGAREKTPATTYRFSIDFPPAEPMALDAPPALALSPDGTSFVYTVPRGDATELRRRFLDRLEPARIPGTEGAYGPFAHGAAREIGFFVKSQMLRLAPDETAPSSLGEAAQPRGASWLLDQIVFSPRTEGGLHRIASKGAPAAELTTLLPDRGEKSHRWPFILPGGERVLFTSWNERGFDVDAVVIASGERKRLIENATYPRYVPTGHLLFVRDFTLIAQAFDAYRLEPLGEPAAVVENVHYDTLTGAAFYDVSEDGTLVYVPRQEERNDEDVRGRLLALGRTGGVRLVNPVSRAYQVPRVSPSGKDLLMILTERGATDVWSMNLGRATLTRVTSEGQNGIAVWHPLGDRIAFAAERGGAFNIFSKPIDSSEAEKRLTESPNTQFPTSYSPDGTRLAYVELDAETQLDIWIWSERGRPLAFQNTPANESAAVFSPDGRYLAYVSNESGEDEVYVRPADGSSGKWPISGGGGVEPVWSADGSELFYRDDSWLVAVPIDGKEGFEPGVPRPLFEAPFDEVGAPYANYDVTRNGSEFIMVRTDEGREAKNAVVVVNWVTELQDRVPARR
jgi:serine/threonine-protein kinase